MARVTDIYGKAFVADYLSRIEGRSWTRETISRWMSGKLTTYLSFTEYRYLEALLPKAHITPENCKFRFIDLFAGIGGIRKGFEDVGGLCVFTSEWDKEASRTYRANFDCHVPWHTFQSDIREVTLSDRPDISTDKAYDYIRTIVPDHDVLLAGFPCQPFSIAGVSKKKSLGRATGFEDKAQGTLFFDTARILAAKRPAIFVLENVKNLKSHDHGRTFQIIMEVLDELGYIVANSGESAGKDPKIIDGKNFLPQHRERIVLIGFRKDLGIGKDFSLSNIFDFVPEKVPTLGELLEKDPDPKYILSENLWKYLYEYAEKHRSKGNGFGFGLVNESSITRTLSARYYKDGSEILIDRGWDFSKGFDDPENMLHRPRRLTPLECSRLMGFNAPNETSFRIPVSDTRAYKQFGNSVVVPVFRAIAKMLLPILESLR
ncbi:MAG: DNA (cytosine-5-)-methyltransferase [Segatella copri]